MKNELKKCPIVFDAADTTESSKNVFLTRISDYLAWAESPDSYGCILALPPLQRGAVWRPRQIADLWDSLLRRMPIGSFILSHLGEGANRMDLKNSNQRMIKEDDRGGFFLLDGQQRTLAMLLGWPSDCSKDTNQRLWIDVGASGIEGRQFRFQVTDRAHPFGYQPDLDKKLSAKATSDALNQFNKTSKNKNLANKPIHELPLTDTTPWSISTESKNRDLSTQRLLPVQELLKNHITYTRIHNQSEDWPDFAAKAFSIDVLTPRERERLTDIRKGLDYLFNAHIPLSLVPNDIVAGDPEAKDGSHHPLILLFNRLSRGGTGLSQGELLFSMIKNIYPKAHNLIQDIHNINIERRFLVGATLSNIDLIMSATRLACIETEGLSDKADPKAKDFHRYLGKGGILDENGKGPLDNLISHSEGGTQSKLSEAFQVLGETLLYKPNSDNDPGLPLAFFPFLGKHLIQVLLFWIIYVRKSKETISPDERMEIIRFTIFWKLCDLGRNGKASQKAITLLKEENKRFPGKHLYLNLTDCNSDGDFLFLRKIIPPDAIKRAVFFGEEEGTPPSWESLIKNKTIRDFFSPFFYGHRPWLIWIQRDLIERDFKDFNFLVSRSERDMVPYDFDHLVPQTHWGAHWKTIKNQSKHILPESISEDFHYRRSIYGNSIGNYRIISASENRKRQDESLTKYFSLELKLNDPPMKQWVDSAFYPKEDELSYWIESSPEEPSRNNAREWSRERIISFQKATTSRSLALYERLFEDCKFSEWMEDKSSTNCASVESNNQT